MFKFNLGDVVQDSITKYEGVVTSQTRWLNGCVTYHVQSMELSKDGTPQKLVGFDEPQLVFVSAGTPAQTQENKAYAGGPERYVEQPNR